mmetsp:Transcript_16393/g.42902  ORF Transcript_16393/g.42902 Transcript_16393/m.42902 type:complete len:429 (+) Transcript_16393:109-1395(+)|eukprot:CAMPEP_0202385244 /NCGR_PEP_ID=MMETSP1127-20130417/59636_1 /ASSEMBLY_ACC=CAM_ASM_000462 /TAXON_ID=3047 /ORGANISM="Dunaliella tertiolecta, Strain CCMP1320" /LENGTH=428 /DNA_ID=CAMNT_0048985331 /DNA_START=91 /DNA_END=1377 /DNA_ORIENTATION=-
MRGSGGLQGGQAAPVLSLTDLPATALSAIHTALLVEESDGFCALHKDAATFRLACKTLRDAAVLPSTLKLSLPVSRTSLLPSLAALLARTAASTDLSLQLTEPRVSAAEEEEAASDVDTPSYEDDSGGWDATADEDAEASTQDVEAQEMEADDTEATNTGASWFDAVPNLKILGDWLHSLDLPCHHSISDLLYTISHDLPYLQHLVLHLCDDAFAKFDLALTEPWGDPESREKVRTRNSQLCSVTLSVSHDGKGPFQLSQGDLDLSKFSALQRFLLRGPFVKKEACYGVNPLVLPPHVQVTIDPGLCGRRPTPWARELTVYETFEAMPESAIPNKSEYKEEDAEAREERKRLFVKKVTARALKLNGGRASEHYEFLLEFTSRALDDAAVEVYMDDEACLWRSDTLFYDVDTLAQKMVNEYSDFARGSY